MIPRMTNHGAVRRPRWMTLLAAAVLTVALVSPGTAEAQRRRRRRRPPAPPPPPAAETETPQAAPAEAPGPAPKGKMTKLDFTGLDLTGKQRTPQLLYFLERAGSELQAAFLERRSFIPEMLRSLEEERL